MYFILYTTLLYFVFIKNKNEDFEEKENKIGLVLCIVLTLMAGFRYYIGTDYGTYVEIFNGISTINDYDYLELGFRLVILFIKIFTSSEYIIFLVMAIISMIFFYEGLKKTSKNLMVSLYIFYCIFYIGYIFNGVRQGVAMCIFIFALNYFEEKKWKEVLVLTIIAMSFHSSGLYIGISYFIYNMKLNKKVYIAAFILGIISCFFNPLEQILTNVNILGIGEKIQEYSSYGGGISFISICQRICIIGIFIISLDKMTDKDKKMFNVYMLGWLAYSAFSFQTIVATRINMFFRMIEIILFANILSDTEDEKYKKFIYIFIIAWTSLILITDLQNSHNFPYRFIWNK